MNTITTATSAAHIAETTAPPRTPKNSRRSIPASGFTTWHRNDSNECVDRGRKRTSSEQASNAGGTVAKRRRKKVPDLASRHPSRPCHTPQKLEAPVHTRQNHVCIGFDIPEK